MQLISIRKKVVTGVAYSAAIFVLTAALPAVATAQTQTRPRTPASPQPRPAATRPASRPSSAIPMWTGFYAGGLFGGSMGKASATTSTVFSPTGYFATTSVPAIATAGVQELKPSKAPWGGQAGYDYQSGKIVFGGVFDITSMRLSESTNATAEYPCCAPTAFTITQSIETSRLITMRGRAGYAFGQMLAFGTIGLAWTDLNYQATFDDTFATAHESGGVDGSQNAVVWGLGAEYRGSPRWSVRGEWLHADFGDVTATSTNMTAFTPAIAFADNVFTHTASFTVNAIRGAINIRF